MEHADLSKLFHVEQLLYNRYINPVFYKVIVLDFPCIRSDSRRLHCLHCLLNSVDKNTYIPEKRASLPVAFPLFLLIQEICYQALRFLHIQFSFDYLLQHCLSVLKGG